MAQGKTILVIGLGAIGSHLAPHLARMSQLQRITLIDRDTYDNAGNLTNQNIVAADVGRPKALVQAERLRKIRPDLDVIAIHASLESVPLGDLRADLSVAALDSRGARQAYAERAWHLGVPFVDSGVLASEGLARVNVYIPSEQQPCFECAWSSEDYKLLEQAYPCGNAAAVSTQTGGSSALGALAAALAALESLKLLDGHTESAVIGRQATWNAHRHRCWVTKFRRNPNCRFDHVVWRIEPLRCRLDAMTIADLGSAGRVGVPGHRFSRRRVCAICGRSESGFRLDRAVPQICCRRIMITPGFDVVETLTADLPVGVQEMTLEAAGLRYGDVLGMGDHYWELAPEPVMAVEK